MPTRTWFPLTPRTVMVTSSPIMTVSPTRRVRMSIFHILCRSSFRFAAALQVRHQPLLFVLGSVRGKGNKRKYPLEGLRHGVQSVLRRAESPTSPAAPQPPPAPKVPRSGARNPDAATPHHAARGRRERR